MAFIRYLHTAAVLLFAYVDSQAQTIYYPAGSSQLLRSTAEDVAMLLQRSIAGSHFTTQQYTAMPANGIVLVYDSTITVNQTCKVKGNGSSFISFAAGQDNGLCYGVYEYLYQSGFRFYQPGIIWETTPSLTSPYKNIDTVYTCRFKYKSWFISGGVNVWAMDKNANYYWDNYYGELGHQWALYQRRNNMTGGYRFAGHRDDVVTSDYLTTLQNNPCYVAPFNDSREATRQSVPDINSVAAMQLWANAIESQYTQYRNRILGNAGFYVNQYRNFNFNYYNIGIEVPDGSHWANSENNDCGSGKYPKESDQHFTLANFTADKIAAVYPGKRFQLYAYDGHADAPSSSIKINPGIDVQVVPTAFQNETSPKALLNRWYKRWPNISEYHYLNLAQWSGETPAFYLDDLKQTVQRLKEKNAQGIIWEASASKFASLPFLLAANNSLKNDKAIENQLQEFCSLFDNAAPTIYKLLQCWSDDKTVTVYYGMQDNKYKLPYYYKLVQQAGNELQNASPVVQQRLNELKAYLHYMVLYYSWTFDQRLPEKKKDKAAALCLYLGKISSLQIVNSYFLIQDIVRQYQPLDYIYIQYNHVNGTAYQNGNLPLITAAEINTNFITDAFEQDRDIKQFAFKGAQEIKGAFESKGLEPLEEIKVKINYTYGKDYSARTEYNFIANAAGGISIKYNPTFDMPGKGYINFSVEATDKTLGVLQDFTIDRNSPAGIVYVTIPAAGNYKLSIVSKYKSAVDILIKTNGNYFYKNGPFFGSPPENYRANLLSLPGFFYVPEGINKVFFSHNNSYSAANGFVKAEEVNRIFAFKDKDYNSLEAKISNSGDSALFYLDVPAGNDGNFLQVFKMEQLRLCFSNISNTQWYARRKVCSNADFTASIKNVNSKCITELTVSGTDNNIKWEVYDALMWYRYSNTSAIELPEIVSPNAIVTLQSSDNCIVTKRLGDITGYMDQKSSCATGSPVAEPSIKVVVYPNPGSGVFMCKQNNEPVLAEDVKIYTVQGMQLASFTHTQRFNIAHLPAAMYVYSIIINKKKYTGKLVKI